MIQSLTHANGPFLILLLSINKCGPIAEGMSLHGQPVGAAEKGVMDKFQVPYDVHESRHATMLKEIISSAVRSSVYEGRLTEVNGLAGLSELPLTSYDLILRSMDEQGVEKTLLERHERFFHTSGSTGSAKRFYYSVGDINSMVLDYVLFTHMIGMEPDDIGWNFGGSEPLVSGLVMDRVASKIPMDKCITTLLGGFGPCWCFKASEQGKAHRRHGRLGHSLLHH